MTARQLNPDRPSARRSVWMLNVLLLGAAGLFAAGVFAPLLTLTKFFIFSNTVSLATSLHQLLAEGYYGLFLVIFLFSIVMPLVKLTLLFVAVNGGRSGAAVHQRYLHWLARYGKWSMLDVFVVAVLLASVKLGDVAAVKIHYGLYAFALSVLITMGTAVWLVRQRPDDGAVR
jgi:paraquat-inducible protein A